jgi:hypothetical protein
MQVSSQAVGSTHHQQQQGECTLSRMQDRMWIEKVAIILMTHQERCKLPLQQDPGKTDALLALSTPAPASEPEWQKAISLQSKLNRLAQGNVCSRPPNH